MSLRPSLLLAGVFLAVHAGMEMATQASRRWTIKKLLEMASKTLLEKGVACRYQKDWVVGLSAKQLAIHTISAQSKLRTTRLTNYSGSAIAFIIYCVRHAATFKDIV